MLAYLCDRCAGEVSEEHYRNSKGGELLCGRCSNQTGKFACDLCHVSLSVDDLRSKRATITASTTQKPGAILCEKCGDGTTKGTRELRYFLALFAICLAIPLVSGAFLHFFRQKTVAAQPNKRSLLPLTREIEKLNASIERLKARREKPRPEKLAKLAQIKEKLPAHSKSLKREKRRAIDYLYLEKLVSSIAQKAISPKILKLKNGTPREKIEAILQIASFREQAAIPFLETALKDDFSLVRSLSARTLGSLGSQHSVGKLMATLGDPENTVRNSAARALSRLTGETFIFYEDVSPEKWQQLQKIKQYRNKKTD